MEHALVRINMMVELVIGVEMSISTFLNAINVTVLKKTQLATLTFARRKVVNVNVQIDFLVENAMSAQMDSMTILTVNLVIVKSRTQMKVYATRIVEIALVSWDMMVEDVINAQLVSLDTRIVVNVSVNWAIQTKQYVPAIVGL